MIEESIIISHLPEYLRNVYNKNVPLTLLINSFLSSNPTAKTSEVLDKITEFLFAVYTNKYHSDHENKYKIVNMAKNFDMKKPAMKIYNLHLLEKCDVDEVWIDNLEINHTQLNNPIVTITAHAYPK